MFAAAVVLCDSSPDPAWGISKEYLSRWLNHFHFIFRPFESMIHKPSWTLQTLACRSSLSTKYFLFWSLLTKRLFSKESLKSSHGNTSVTNSVISRLLHSLKVSPGHFCRLLLLKVRFGFSLLCQSLLPFATKKKLFFSPSPFVKIKKSLIKLFNERFFV